MYGLCKACVKLIQSGLDKRNSTFRIPLLKPLSLSLSLCLSQLRLLFFLSSTLVSYSSADGDQRGKKMDFVGIMMGCLMLEVAEELRDMPF